MSARTIILPSSLEGRAAFLHAFGIVAGKRDPKMNRAFNGAYMVADAYPEGYAQDDARGGYQCVVGDDLNALINERLDDLLGGLSDDEYFIVTEDEEIMMRLRSEGWKLALRADDPEAGDVDEGVRLKTGAYGKATIWLWHEETKRWAKGEDVLTLLDAEIA